MALTKYGLAEQALRILSGGDISKDSEIQIREMMLAVSQARDFVVRQELWQLLSIGESFIPAEYITSFENIEVKKDDVKDLYYSILPAEYVQLPKNMGVYQVSLMKDQYNAFVPTEPSFFSMYRGLASQNLSGRKGYFIEGNRLYYTNLIPSDEIEKVLVKMVVASRELEEDDVFPIPADKEMQVIQMAIQMYSTAAQIPNDQLNDNA